MIKIIIADDHDIVREGLRKILETYDDMKVVGEAGTGRETLEVCEKTSTDVLLLDLDMPDMSGLEVLKNITSTMPNLKIIMLTMHDNVEYASRALRGGASGFMLKNSPPGELPAAIRKVASGEPYIIPSMMEKIALQRCDPAGESVLSLLSDRELQILTGLARFAQLKDIAEELDLSVSTVATYKQRIKKKLDLSKNADLTRFAIKHSLGDTDSL